MEFDKISLTAELFKNSKYFQDHVKNETREDRKNCKFCKEIIPSFVELWMEKEKETGRKILIQAEKTDEILHIWEILYDNNS